MINIIGLNLNIRWADKEANFKQIERQYIDTEADIFLLPEMFSTGFCMEPEMVADRNEETLNWMKSFAIKKNAVVAGSASVEEDGKFYNRFYFVKPDLSYEYYDKRHLFSYSGENKIYTPGKERKVILYKGIRILLQVCFDLRFPVFTRNTEDYDVALYVANWPDSRVYAWETLLKARSIENQAYVFGLNRIGTDDYGLQYPESSHCFFPDGEDVAKTENNLVRASIDIEKLQKFREKFPFLKDRDYFSLEL